MPNMNCFGRLENALSRIDAKKTLARSLFAAGLLALALACGMFGKEKEEELLPDLIRTVEKGDLLEEVSESGKITASFEVPIKSKVSGEVLEVLVEEGQTVKQGDLLLTLVDHDYRRDLELAKVGVDRAKLELEAAELERQRREMALASRGISQNEYDSAARQADLAKVNLRRAKVEYEASQDRVSYTRIQSPIDGTVIHRNVEKGELITAGVTATVNGVSQLTIAQTDVLRLEIELNQVDVGRVAVGQEAKILLDAFPGESVTGKVTQVAAAGHRSDQRGVDVFTVKVEVNAADTKVNIKPGMTAEVRIQIGKYPQVVKVPVESVFNEEGKDYIYAIDEKDGAQTKEKREIKIGNRGGRELEIASGLQVGEKYYAAGEVKDLSSDME